MKKWILFLASMSISLWATAQMKAPQTVLPSGKKHQPQEVGAVMKPWASVQAAPAPARTHWALPAAPVPLSGNAAVPQLLRVHLDPATRLPRWVEGRRPEAVAATPEATARKLLARTEALLQWPADGWQVRQVRTDALGMTHVRLQQVKDDRPVYGGELVVHIGADGVPFLINGRYFRVDAAAGAFHLAKAEAEQIAVQEATGGESLRPFADVEKLLAPGPQLISEACWWAGVDGALPARPAWRVQVMPHLLSRQTVWVDATTGEVLHRQEEVCNFAGRQVHALPPDGPATAQAYDLHGQVRTIHTYEVNGAFYLIDASRPMFDAAASNLPDEPVGAIWTITANGTSPQNDDFSASHLATADNQWDNPTAVSAHYNGGVAYEYFRTTFGRNSIDGVGGTIISLIDVTEADGSEMDNAFWNGQAMFYGNGNQAFTAPLAKALDVAGHEMAHGVIQAEANLEYYGESGAINEHFADVFGTMIDRDDWKLGEDVANGFYFPSGALRNMENPHNGGNSLNDPGWQPAHTSEQYFGNQDNGGVHINSGIPNRAYYIFATAVSKDKAEQVWYRALTQYLTKSSQFADLRLAVVQSAADLYGANSAEVQAAANAFDLVGIGTGGAGTGGGNDYTPNPGDDFVLLSDANLSALYIFSPDGQPVANPLTTIAPLSKPSLTDDGSVAVYIASDQTMRAIIFDWQNGTFEETTIQSDPIWRNVAIARDGSRIAALTDDYDNRVWVYDFGLEEWVTFELYNPTTATGGITTNDVQYADVLEFDFSGQWVMYDAFNRIEGTFGNDIEYWDIGFVRVWDGSADYWGDGFVDKLFNTLPENSSVGNPAFSKNSDYIIAFDFLDEFAGEYYVLAANIETGDVGAIYQNTTLGYPNYSVADDFMVFDATAGAFDDPVLAMIPLAPDKISAGGDPFVFIEQGKWGVWFATGERPLTGTAEQAAFAKKLGLTPNPASDLAELRWQGTPPVGTLRVRCTDLNGRILWERTWQPATDATLSLPVQHLPKGIWLIEVTGDVGTAALRLLKQ